MNETVNKFLLAGDKFMPEIHLKQLRFTYSAWGAFTKNKERRQKFKETEDSIYIYKNELYNACFQHDIAYAEFKDLAKRTASYKILNDKAFSITKKPKYHGYQKGLSSMVYKFFDKRSKDSSVNYEIKQNEQLAEDLHKPIIRKFKKRRVYSSFKENMQVMGKFNKKFGFYYVLLIFLANMHRLFL